MDPLIGGALIGGGFGLLGNVLSHFGGGGSDTAMNDQRFMNDFAWKQALRQEEYNNFYTQNYMQIRAKDAAAAGLHPLAALGVNVASGPTSAAFSGSGGSGRRNAYDLGSDMAHTMGQNISRAVAAQKTADERILMQAQLEKNAAEIDLVQAQAAETRMRTAAIGSNPPIPDPYSGLTGDVLGLPSQHKLYRTPYGYTAEWSPDFAVSMMSRPVKGTLQDIHDMGRENITPKLRAILQMMYGARNYRSNSKWNLKDE